MNEDSGLSENLSVLLNTSTQLTHYTLLYETERHRIYSAQLNGRRFILKGLQKNHPQADLLFHLLQREFHLLEQLENPYIVRAWQLVQDSQVGWCIVMEYIDGEPLNTWVTHHPSREDRKQVLDEIFSVVRYLHSKQIIHGDIKPQNILVCSNGHIKIIDFDFSSKDEYIANNIGHTTQYAAPEQKNGDTDCFDNRADIYAIGILLRLLFHHRYWYISRRCCRANPKKRYSDVRDIQRAIHFRWIWILVLIMGLVVADLVVRAFSITHPSIITAPIVPSDTSSVISPITPLVASPDTSPTISPVISPVTPPVTKRTVYVHDTIYAIRDTIAVMPPERVRAIDSAAKAGADQIIKAHEQKMARVRQHSDSCSALGKMEIDSVIDQYFFSLKDIYSIYHDVREIKECAHKIYELNCRKAIGDFCSHHPDCVDDVYSTIHVNIQLRIKAMKDVPQSGTLRSKDYQRYKERISPEEIYLQLKDSLAILQRTVEPLYGPDYLKQFEK